MIGFSSMHHSFDVGLAAKYGIEEAILIHHFQHWIRINRFKDRNIYDGKCWTYQSRKEIQAHFPYMSYETIKYRIERLIFLGVLVAKNFNKNRMDKTLWYAFVDEKKFMVDEDFSNNVYERENSPSIGKIPHSLYKDTDTKPTYTKKKNKQKETTSVSAGLAFFFFEEIRKIKKDFKKPDLEKWAQEIEKIISIDKREPEKIKLLIAWALNHEFWHSNILSPQKLRKQFDRLDLQMNKKKTVTSRETNEISEMKIYNNKLKTNKFLKENWNSIKGKIYFCDKGDHLCIEKEKLFFNDNKFDEKFKKLLTTYIFKETRGFDDSM
jgi:hypothetical protein